jgi:hypothetical protein
MLDTRPHGEERAGDVITVGKIMLCDHRRGFLVIHMRVWIFLFELAQRLDAMVGKDN